jgi:hypothetical protein
MAKLVTAGLIGAPSGLLTAGLDFGGAVASGPSWLVTAGLGADAVGLLLTRGLGGYAYDPPVTTDYADLVEAIYVEVGEDSALVTAFDDQEGWLWHTVAPPDQPIPLAVLRADESTPLGETGSPTPWMEDASYSVTVYAYGRGSARALCRQVMTAIEASADAGDLISDEGQVAGLLRVGDGLDARDPDPGPNGEDVWSHRITFRAFVDPDTI